jgi:SPP1 family predicted phage head-tail adaptor
MTIGNKQKRITIETPNLIPDGQGGTKPGVPAYLVRAVVWAHERPLTGREALAKAQLAAVLSSVWEIWFRTDLSVKDRIRYRTRVVNVEAFEDPTDARDELYVYCSEVQA